MKLHFAIPAALGILALSVYGAHAIEPARGDAPVAAMNAPGAQVRVNGEQGTRGADVHVGTPNVGVDVRAPIPPIARENLRGDGRVQGGTRMETSLIADNRPERWRYKWESNRWWYWGPDNRWMWYSEPGGWTYYVPGGGYTTSYGGVAVAPGTEVVVPPTTYYYPYSGYYYGYPRTYYYGRPGFYYGGRWGRRW